MSRFSGKCDLADHIFMCKTHEVPGGLASDPLEAFEEFKKRTGGKIHQHIKINKVDEWNQTFIKEHCNMFDFIKHTEQIPDRRNKDGVRTVTYFTYVYWGKEYTEKELNKKGVYITKDINFNTLLDLIPYFPYIVSMSCSSDGKETVYISDQSYVDEEEIKLIQHGYLSMAESYRKELANFYLQVCRDYFLKDIEQRTKTKSITNLIKKDDGYYLVLEHDKIDYMHDIKYTWLDGKVHLHWTSPKFINENTIKLSKEDVEQYLKTDIETEQVTLQYVSKTNLDLHLN